MTRVDWTALCGHREVETLVGLAIAEDVGDGDITTQAVFRRGHRVRGRFLARSETVVCGVPLADQILRRFDADAVLSDIQPEGTSVAAGDTLFAVECDVCALLAAERCVLNFLMRLCGVAANARRATSALPPGSRTRVLDTRKTVPGWRRLDKAAVLTGGADNHRFGLFDAVLIKDNHIEAAGSVTHAVRQARDHAGPTVLVEVEIDRIDQLEAAIEAGADIVLLDNFDLEGMRAAVTAAAGRVSLEASGGVTEDRIAAIAATGVDRISLGALTHSVMPPDLSLDLETVLP
jgi:nicotinate-nucleotide pyrophosphorylase (carboxylating)